MKRYFYDLHIHSCLSPCGDGDSTPNNIAGMASLCGLDIVALTDHNTCKNCPAFFEAAKKYGVVPVAGMELTTSEDIHVVCLFEDIEGALAFDGEVDGHRIKIKNRPDIFGEQPILNGNDEVIGEEEYLLINATDISIESVPEMVKKYGGICYPAHIDRASNGAVAVLGTFPQIYGAYEINDPNNVDEYKAKYLLENRQLIISSDAHSLTQMRDKENSFELDCEPISDELVRKHLFQKLNSLV